MFAKHRKKPTSVYSKIIIFFCIVIIICFTQTCLYFYWNDKSVDPVLIGFFFACFGMEFASLAFIKRGEYRYIKGDKLGYAEKIEEEENEQADKS